MADPSSVLSITNSSLSTPIHLAASHGHQGALLLLINSAADTSDLNARDRAGNTALSLAAHHGHSTCVKALIFFSESKPRHLDLNGQNKAGNTPLHLAARWGFEVVRFAYCQLYMWNTSKSLPR